MHQKYKRIDSKDFGGSTGKAPKITTAAKFFLPKFKGVSAEDVCLHTCPETSTSYTTAYCPQRPQGGEGGGRRCSGPWQEGGLKGQRSHAFDSSVTLQTHEKLSRKESRGSELSACSARRSWRILCAAQMPQAPLSECHCRRRAIELFKHSHRV